MRDSGDAVVTNAVAATLAYIVLFAFLVFLAWEVLQTPLYHDVTDDINMIVWYRVHCTLGDIGILLGAMGIVSAFRRGLRWIGDPARRDLLVVTALGVAYTTFSEYLNVRVVDRWAYSDLMPTVAGIGLAPLAQWLLLPALVVKLSVVQSRGLLAGRPAEAAPPSDE